MFNFKNSECQEKFYHLTETKNELGKCFQNEKDFERQSTEWFQNLSKYFHQSFTKIRSRADKKKFDDVYKLMNDRTELVQKMKKANDEQKEDLQRELEEVEMKISELSAKENRNKVVENFATLTTIDGTTNQRGVWDIKRKIFPKNKESLPFAKTDFEGKLVTSQRELKSLYLKTFTSRLRHRPIKKGLENLKVLKEELCAKRMNCPSLTNLTHGK
jgi:hypothetical protein